MVLPELQERNDTLNLEDLQKRAEDARLVPPNYKKMSKIRRMKWIEANAQSILAELPEDTSGPVQPHKASRQVLRAESRREKKMPVSMPPSLWHRSNGYPTNNPRKDKA